MLKSARRDLCGAAQLYHCRSVQINPACRATTTSGHLLHALLSGAPCPARERWRLPRTSSTRAPNKMRRGRISRDPAEAVNVRAIPPAPPGMVAGWIYREPASSIRAAGIYVYEGVIPLRPDAEFCVAACKALHLSMPICRAARTSLEIDRAEFNVLTERSNTV